LSLWLFPNLLRFAGFFVSGWPLLGHGGDWFSSGRVMFLRLLLCSVLGCGCFGIASSCWCPSRVVEFWCVCNLRVETCLTRFRFYHCSSSFCLTELLFGFWWGDHFCFEIESYRLVTYFWARLVSSMVAWNLRGAFLIMGLGGRPRFDGVLFLIMGLGGRSRLGGFCFLCLFSVFAYIRCRGYVFPFLLVFVRLVKRPG
jgi:hypothetical protein